MPFLLYSSASFRQENTKNTCGTGVSHPFRKCSLLFSNYLQKYS